MYKQFPNLKKKENKLEDDYIKKRHQLVICRQKLRTKVIEEAKVPQKNKM